MILFRIQIIKGEVVNNHFAFFKYLWIIIFSLCLNFNTQAQYENINWCFGDSCAVNFSSGQPLVTNSVIYSQECAVTISNNQGDLLFYAGDQTFSSFYSVIKNSLHQTMQNGDSLRCSGSYTNGMIIIPDPGDTNQYYIFHVGPYAPNLYLYYSKVDMSLQSGLGEVISKNNIIANSINASERVTAIKHGNGRDWWILFKLFGSNEFKTVLVNPTGIAGPFSQFIGSVHSNFLSYAGEFAVSQSGSKIAVVTLSGIVNAFDFNRCTGQLSNWKNLGPSNPGVNQDQFYGCEFSPNENFLYVTTMIPPFTRLIQFDLTLPLPNPDTIYSNVNDSVSFGQLQLGPDNKIYMANVYDPHWPNSTYDSLNMYLGVINNPDFNGISCNFLPYSYYLGGRRSFYSLPNMVNYNLGPLNGSACDTITFTHFDDHIEGYINIIPNPFAENFVVYFYSLLTPEENIELSIYTVTGKKIYETCFHGEKEIYLPNVRSGIYSVKIRTKENLWFKKIIKL